MGSFHPSLSFLYHYHPHEIIHSLHTFLFGSRKDDKQIFYIKENRWCVSLLKGKKRFKTKTFYKLPPKEIYFSLTFPFHFLSLAFSISKHEVKVIYLFFVCMIFRLIFESSKLNSMQLIRILMYFKTKLNPARCPTALAPIKNQT